MLEKLNEKIKALGPKFETDLKNLITEKGHKGKGTLLNSIKVKVNKQGDDYILEINALEYIQYLDNGKLIEDFKRVKRDEIEKILQEEVSKELANLFKQIK